LGEGFRVRATKVGCTLSFGAFYGLENNLLGCGWDFPDVPTNLQAQINSWLRLAGGKIVSILKLHCR
jgi:hypothetical protein